MFIKHIIFSLKVFLLAMCLASCKDNARQERGYEPVYSAGEKSKNLFTIGVAGRSFYEPLELVVKCLNKKGKLMQFKLVTTSNYSDFLKKEKEGAFDMTITNGLDALGLQDYGYKIIAKYGDDNTYYSVIYVNKKSSIHQINDLKGKKVSLSAKKSVLGDLAPVVFLKENGIDIGKDIDTIYSPSFESCILSTYFGRSDAGVAWKTMWDNYVLTHPYITDRLELKWETKPLINLAILVKKELDEKTTEAVIRRLLSLQDNAEGRYALGQMKLKRLERADSGTYLPMLAFKKKYEQLTKK